jgi:hypothetical protein
VGHSGIGEWRTGGIPYRSSGKGESRNIGHQDSRSREVRNPDEVTGPLKGQSASSSEFRRIGYRESENQVARHCECRNPDKESPDKAKEKVSVDQVSGFVDS